MAKTQPQPQQRVRAATGRKAAGVGFGQLGAPALGTMARWSFVEQAQGGDQESWPWVLGETAIASFSPEQVLGFVCLFVCLFELHTAGDNSHFNAHLTPIFHDCSKVRRTVGETHLPALFVQFCRSEI